VANKLPPFFFPFFPSSSGPQKHGTAIPALHVGLVARNVTDIADARDDEAPAFFSVLMQEITEIFSFPSFLFTLGRAHPCSRSSPPLCIVTIVRNSLPAAWIDRWPNVCWSLLSEEDELIIEVGPPFPFFWRRLFQSLGQYPFPAVLYKPSFNISFPTSALMGACPILLLFCARGSCGRCERGLLFSSLLEKKGDT